GLGDRRQFVDACETLEAEVVDVPTDDAWPKGDRGAVPRSYIVSFHLTPLRIASSEQGRIARGSTLTGRTGRIDSLRGGDCSRIPESITRSERGSRRLVGRPTPGSQRRFLCTCATSAEPGRRARTSSLPAGRCARTS